MIAANLTVLKFHSILLLGYDISTTIKVVSFIYKTLNELLPNEVDQTLR